MKKLISILFVLVCISSCSSRQSFVVVEESEFGDWQWEVAEITTILNEMNMPYTDDEEVLAVFDKIESIKERMERLDKHIHKNFLHSDEIGSQELPTRYAD